MALIKQINERMINPNKNIFICYRGGEGIGGLVANSLYYNILMSEYESIVPFCALVNNRNENFEKRSIECIKEHCRIFVVIFTENFFDAWDDDDDQVWKEFYAVYETYGIKYPEIKFFPLFVNNTDKSEIYSRLFDWFFDKFSDKSEETKGKVRNFIDDIKHFSDSCNIEVVCNKIDDGYNAKSYFQSNIEKAVAGIYDLSNAPQKNVDGIWWVGTRLSDIKPLSGSFQIKGAVTLFGENNENNNTFAMCSERDTRRVNHNNLDKEQDKYISDKLHSIVEASKSKCYGKLSQSPKFYFYNQICAYTIGKELCDQEFGVRSLNDICEHFMCVNNNSNLVLRINNKKTFHEEYAEITDKKGKKHKDILLEVKSDGSSYDTYSDVCASFGVENSKTYHPKFIVQANIASGGSGTYIMTEENFSSLKSQIALLNGNFIYSIYRECNVPVNMHAIIFKNGILMLPGSIQLMRVDYEHYKCEQQNAEVKRLMYRGADFIEFKRISKLKDSEENKINSRHINEFKEKSLLLCQKLQEEGYIGILGIDGMIYVNGTDIEVRLLEINCRFQASTGLINRALQDRAKNDPEYNFSVQQINMEAFYGNISKERVERYQDLFDDLIVNYSNYSYNYIGSHLHTHHIHDLVENNECEILEDDGYNINYDVDSYTNDEIKSYGCVGTEHLYRVVFNKNISWVSEDCSIFIEPNIVEPIKDLESMIISCGTEDHLGNDNLIALKTALLIQGIRIDKTTKEYYLKKCNAKGIRPATNDAVDIRFSREFCDKFHINSDTQLVINTPLAEGNKRFIRFSPFTLTIPEDETLKCGDLELRYYGKMISIVSLYPLDPLENKRINGHYYSEAAYLSTDRLRVHLTNHCYYKKLNKGCKFCNISCTGEDIGLDVIEYVVKEHWKHRKESGLEHFLIGGQSPDNTPANREETKQRMIKIIQMLRGLEGAPTIYAMILPTSDKETLEDYYNAGLREITFNIEIFDEILAHKYMPGKCEFTRAYYKESLVAARDVWKKKSNRLENVKTRVRSMVIYGLEPEKSFIDGIQWMIDEGIQPMISVFRPLDGALDDLKNFVAPPVEKVVRLYEDITSRLQIANEVSSSKNYRLGPDCSCCQNNTLSLPKELL